MSFRQMLNDRRKRRGARAAQALVAARQEPHYAYLGQNTGICRTIYGHKIYVDTRDVSLAPCLIMDGDWEPWITQAIRELLRPGMKCVDLGANFGWYSLLMAQQAGAKGFVLCADANPRMVELCRRSLSVNGFAATSSVSHLAISSKAGTLTFHAPDMYMGGASLSDVSGVAGTLGDTVKSFEVNALSLDEFTAGQDVDFIKIDCEGAEPAILRGGHRTLAAPGIQVLLEYTPGNYKNGEPQEMIDTLSGEGFKFFNVQLDSSLQQLNRDQLLNISGWSELFLRR